MSRLDQQMKKIFQAPFNWIIYDEDISISDSYFQFIIEFETKIMRKYFDINDYQVLADITDIDFVVSADHQEKIDKMLQDNQISLGEDLKIRENGKWQGYYIFFPRGEIGDYELMNS